MSVSGKFDPKEQVECSICCLPMQRGNLRRHHLKKHSDGASSTPPVSTLPSVVSCRAVTVVEASSSPATLLYDPESYSTILYDPNMPSMLCHQASSSVTVSSPMVSHADVQPTREELGATPIQAPLYVPSVSSAHCRDVPQSPAPTCRSPIRVQPPGTQQPVYAGLTELQYAQAQRAARQVVEQHDAYDVNQLNNFVQLHFSEIPEAARPYLIIGAAVGAQHASQMHFLWDVNRGSSDPPCRRLAVSARRSLGYWNIGLRDDPTFLPAVECHESGSENMQRDIQTTQQSQDLFDAAGLLDERHFELGFTLQALGIAHPVDDAVTPTHNDSCEIRVQVTESERRMADDKQREETEEKGRKDREEKLKKEAEEKAKREAEERS